MNTITRIIKLPYDNDINIWGDYDALVIQMPDNGEVTYYRRVTKTQELKPISRATFQEHCVGVALDHSVKLASS